MSPRGFVVMIAGALLLVGAYLGFSSMSTTFDDGLPTACGSAFEPAEFPGPECRDKLSTKRTVEFVVLGVGLIALIGGVAVRTAETEAQREHRLRVNGGS